MVTRLSAVLSNLRPALCVTKRANFYKQRLTDGARGTFELTAVSSVHIALIVSGHLGVNMVDRDRVRERPLCTSQIENENARVSQTNDRKGR